VDTGGPRGVDPWKEAAHRVGLPAQGVQEWFQRGSAEELYDRDSQVGLAALARHIGRGFAVSTLLVAFFLAWAVVGATSGACAPTVPDRSIAASLVPP
jgi:hypothetical protein